MSQNTTIRRLIDEISGCTSLAQVKRVVKYGDWEKRNEQDILLVAAGMVCGTKFINLKTVGNETADSS